jgi:dCTP deaminase
MSVLNTNEILKRIKEGNIVISPELDKFQVQPHSIDLRLGYTFLIPKSWRLTEKGRESLHTDHLSKDFKNHFEVIELEKGQFFELLPNEYILASTLESIKLPNDLMSVLYPRSSTNRRGLSVDLTGVIDAGYEGQLVIPIRNNTNSQCVKLYPGERFCQITFSELSSPSSKPKGAYHQKDIAEGLIISGDKKELSLIKKGDTKKLKSDFKIKN